MKPRVVFDTAAVISALLFPGGELSWLRQHWQQEACVPLLSRATAAELMRALSYPKFCLSPEERRELLADYLPWCMVVSVKSQSTMICRDPNDQMFLDLARSGKADVLVSGDKDLLALAGGAAFVIESPAAYRRRVQKMG